MGRKKIYGDHKIIFRLDDKLYDEVSELLERINSDEKKYELVKEIPEYEKLILQK